MTIADDKLRSLPRLVRDGRLKEAMTVAADVFDVASESPSLRSLSPDSLVILRDLLDAAKAKLPE